MRKYFLERFQSEQKDGTPSFLKRPDTTRISCEVKVSKVFERSDELKLLAGAMKKHGCYFNLARHVVCERCENCHGGYDPDTNQIVICQGIMMSKDKILSIMLHEMVHMFDYCRAEFDFENLEHVACSEIRAANLSYCSISDFLRFAPSSLFKFKKAHEICVKEVAIKSVKAYSPQTDISEVVDIVTKVFPKCYNDLEPFGRRPTYGRKETKHAYRERYLFGYIY